MNKQIQFERPWEVASEEDIRSFEACWELRLPSDFRRFCLEQNGGYPSKANWFYPVPEIFEEFWKEYNIPRNCVPGVGIIIFLPIMKKHYNKRSIERTMELLQGSDQLLPNRVPIADDGCGNYLMLSVDKADNGLVFFWDHELHFEFPVAESFSEILKQLTTSPS